MGTKSALPVINEAAAACGQVTRREMCGGCWRSGRWNGMAPGGGFASDS